MSFKIYVSEQLSTTDLVKITALPNSRCCGREDFLRQHQRHEKKTALSRSDDHQDPGDVHQQRTTPLTGRGAAKAGSGQWQLCAAFIKVE